MKLILAVSIVVNIALIVIMLVLKNGYKEQAQVAYKAATTAYTNQVSKVVNAQNAFIKNGNLINKILTVWVIFINLCVQRNCLLRRI